MRWMRLPRVEDKIGLKKSKIYTTMDFPKPIKVGRVSVWNEAEVEEWMRAQLNERERAA